MKKLLSVVVLFMSSLFLVACGSLVSSNQPEDGTYYSFYPNSKEIGISEIIVEDDKLVDMYEYEINSEDGTLIRDGKAEQTFTYKDSILEIDGISYVRYGSKKYQELLDEGYEKQ